MGRKENRYMVFDCETATMPFANEIANGDSKKKKKELRRERNPATRVQVALIALDIITHNLNILSFIFSVWHGNKE